MKRNNIRIFSLFLHRQSNRKESYMKNSEQPMKKRRKLKYNDLKEIMMLEHSGFHNGVVVDDAALEVMLRIEKTMQRLEVMGDDEQRRLWIELKAPSPKYRWEKADENGYYWYQIITAHCDDFHFMLISNGERKYVDLRSAQYIEGERKPDEYYGNVSKALLKLETYVTALVDSICENPDEYNEYINNNLPYSKREGKIKRADLNRICPIYRTFENPGHVVEVVKRMKALPLWSAPKMTLRTYMHFWRLLYVTYRTKDEFRPEPISNYENKSDEEIFRNHSNKGRKIEGFDLDSELDFLKWDDENSIFHNLDIAYARIRFIPMKKGSGWREYDIDVDDGQWYFILSYNIYGYSYDVVNMLEALCNAGVGVVCHSADRLLKMAEETDYVRITPFRNSYAYNEEIGNEMVLPSEDEDITAQQVADVIAATEWEPIKEVKPINENKDENTIHE